MWQHHSHNATAHHVLSGSAVNPLPKREGIRWPATHGCGDAPPCTLCCLCPGLSRDCDDERVGCLVCTAGARGEEGVEGRLGKPPGGTRVCSLTQGSCYLHSTPPQKLTSPTSPTPPQKRMASHRSRRRPLIHVASLLQGMQPAQESAVFCIRKLHTARGNHPPIRIESTSSTKAKCSGRRMACATARRSGVGARGRLGQRPSMKRAGAATGAACQSLDICMCPHQVPRFGGGVVGQVGEGQVVGCRPGGVKGIQRPGGRAAPQQHRLRGRRLQAQVRDSNEKGTHPWGTQPG